MVCQPLEGLTLTLFVPLLTGGLQRSVTMALAAGALLLCSIWFVSASVCICNEMWEVYPFSSCFLDFYFSFLGLWDMALKL